MSILFDRLLDDAAIFPPGNVPMDEAVRAHVAALDGPIARHVGPFVCSATRLAELDAALDAAAVEHMDLALVTPSGAAERVVAAAHDDPRVRLRAVELSPGDGGLPTTPEGTLLLVERSGEPPFDVPDGAALKLRTGGETADAFPDEAWLAAVIHDAVARDLRFKLTAGLHQAVRHGDAVTGFEHHGFLNVMLATHDALAGRTVDDLAATLAEQDATVVAERIGALDDDACGRIRSHFLSFGTCSISEPLDDLHELGLLEVAA